MLRTFKVLVPGLLLLAFVVPSHAVPKITDIPPLIKQLESKDAKERASAARELGRIGLIKVSFVKPAIPALLKAAKDQSDDVRMAALAALGMARPDAEKAIPVFVDALKSTNEKIQVAAMEGLRYYGPAAKEGALPVLLVIDGQLKKLDKDAQKKKRNLMRAVRDTMRALQGKR